MTPFKVISSKEIFKLKNYKLKEDELDIGNNKTSKHFSIVHPGAVVILPKISKDEFVFIKQYRHSLGKTILELPAGTLAENEDPIECAKRELIEETNFEASEWHSLGILYPAPGFCDEIQYLFIAKNLSPKEGIKDEDELIEVVRMKENEIIEAIKNNNLCDGKSLACLYKAQLFEKFD